MEALDEKAEITFLADEEDNYKNTIQEAVDEVRVEFKESVKKHIKDIVLQSLGFSKRWACNDKWEIDHCNSRLSEVGNLVTEEVRRYIIDEQIKITKTKTTLTNKMKKDLRAGFRKDFVNQFRSEVQDIIYRSAREQAQKMANEMIRDMLENHLKDDVEFMLGRLLKPEKIK
jgi:uncharacterized protein YdiU (UPF0061 family)